MQPIEITQLVGPTNAGVGEYESIATPIFLSQMCQYQIVKGKQLVAAFETTRSSQNNPNKVASLFDLGQIQEGLVQDEQDALVFILAKHDYVSTFFEKLKEEPQRFSNFTTRYRSYVF